MEFSERLLTLRKERGLSQEELAERLEVTRQAVSRWESGATLPDAVNLLKLADLFSVSVDWLLRGGEAASAEDGAQAPVQDEPAEDRTPRRKIPHLFCGVCWLVAAGSMVVAVFISGGILYAGLALVDTVISCVHFWFHFRKSEEYRALPWHSMGKESKQYLTAALLFLFASVCFFLAGAIGGNLLSVFAGLLELIASLGFFYHWHKSVNCRET